MKALTPETAKRLEPITPHADDILELRLQDDGKYFLARFYRTQDNEHYPETYPSYHAQNMVRRFPEKSHFYSGSPGEHWRIGATDTTAEIINQCWPKEQLRFEEDEARLLFHYLLLSKSRQDLNAENVAHFREHNLLPLHDHEIHPGMPLARYQELGLVNSMNNEGYALFMEQGTGKTAIVVARICNEAKTHWEKTKKPYLAIIVCPKQLRFNWELEFYKFATQRGRLTRISGPELSRTKQLIEAISVDPEDRYSVVIISYDSLSRTTGLDRIPFDLGVIDESHFIKNPGTKRWQAVRKLRDRCKARMALTGTPITNSILDLYTQWEFLGKGWSGFSSNVAFRQFYGVFDDADGYTGFKKFVGCQNLPFMQERIARQALVFKKEDVMPELPDKVYDVYEVEMTTEQQELYNKVAESIVAEIEDELKGENQFMTVNNILTKMLRLAQVTSGFAVFDPVIHPESGVVLRERIIDRLDPNPKIDALMEILAEKESKDKTIIWAHFHQDIKSISARLYLEGIEHVVFYGKTSDADREEAVRQFNENPKCKVFLGSAGAGGTGLNLLGYPAGHAHEDLYDTNANHVIYFSQDWSMPKRAQSEDRAHRRGTREPVRITDLTVLETIDQAIRERVTAKIDTANSVSDVKNILRNVFNRNF